MEDQTVVQGPNDFNKLPTPLPSKLYLHIEQIGPSSSILTFTDEMHALVDVPENDFWLIENQEYQDGVIHTKILLQSEKKSTIDHMYPHNNKKTYFKLYGGKNYQIRWKSCNC